jgi:hypothetical protein
MRKYAATFFLLFLIQGAGQAIGDMLTLQNKPAVESLRPSLADHEQEVREGNDPSGIFVTG